MPEIVLKHISKVYENGYHAVKDVNLEIQPKEFVIFVRPSGCGSTAQTRSSRITRIPHLRRFLR